MPKVAIVILNWNGWKDTIPCLESLQHLQTKDIDLTLIVVDNHSTDESVTKIKAFKSKYPVKLIENLENLGFAGGNNIGIKAALKMNVDYICLLNNDTLVDKSLLQSFLSASHKYPATGVFTPKIYFAKGYEFHKERYQKKDIGNVIWYTGGDIDWANVYGSNHGVDEIDNGQYDSNRTVDFATGACMFIRSSVLKNVGSFDEKYYLYLEDADLSMRIRNAGYEILYVHQAVVWHKVSQSSGIGSDLNDYFITRNRLIFGMRYAGLRAKYALARESVRLYFGGRPWQRIGVKDFYLGNLGKGSWGR